MDLQADLDRVFYAPDGDFTVQAVRRRDGAADAPFTAHDMVAQRELLDGSISSVARTLRYPAHAVELQGGDTVLVGPETLIVIGEPQLVADGRELEAALARVYQESMA